MLRPKKKNFFLRFNMELQQIEVRLKLILKDHYGADGPEFKELVLDRAVKDVDMDSLAFLEFFLVVEEGFGLEATRLSSKINTNAVLDLSMDKFVRMIAIEVFKIYRGITAS